MKLKTKKAMAKRFKLTATGKIKFKKCGMRHCLGGLSRDQKRGRKQEAYVYEGSRKHIERGLPYGG